ncbi:hypothetical protein AMECASPLE_017203 [Ameca splendens]|uniref:Uncharacterized protein n=1 Tax=Ameca splendens TaxID=208324 RepID=A0ABV0ZY65_9TELE
MAEVTYWPDTVQTLGGGVFMCLFMSVLSLRPAGCRKLQPCVVRPSLSRNSEPTLWRPLEACLSFFFVFPLETNQGFGCVEISFSILCQMGLHKQKHCQLRTIFNSSPLDQHQGLQMVTYVSG